MKFIPIEKAKIEFNAPVFTKNKNGEFGLGKLMEKKHTGKGIEYSFLMAAFEETDSLISTEITHVAKPPYDNKKKKVNPAAKIVEAG